MQPHLEGIRRNIRDRRERVARILPRADRQGLWQARDINQRQDLDAVHDLPARDARSRSGILMCDAQLLVDFPTWWNHQARTAGENLAHHERGRRVQGPVGERLELIEERPLLARRVGQRTRSRAQDRCFDLVDHDRHRCRCRADGHPEAGEGRWRDKAQRSRGRHEAEGRIAPQMHGRRRTVEEELRHVPNKLRRRVLDGALPWQPRRLVHGGLLLRDPLDEIEVLRLRSIHLPRVERRLDDVPSDARRGLEARREQRFDVPLNLLIERIDGSAELLGGRGHAAPAHWLTSVRTRGRQQKGGRGGECGNLATSHGKPHGGQKWRAVSATSDGRATARTKCPELMTAERRWRVKGNGARWQRGRWHSTLAARRGSPSPCAGDEGFELSIVLQLRVAPPWTSVVREPFSMFGIHNEVIFDQPNGLVVIAQDRAHHGLRSHELLSRIDFRCALARAQENAPRTVRE